MHLFRIVVLLGLTLSVLTGCGFKSDFEKFAYEACVKEGKSDGFFLYLNCNLNENLLGFSHFI